MARTGGGRSPSRAFLLWATVGGLALASAAAAAVAAGSLADGPTLCLFRLTTGVPCPGCGLTRGMAWLARGELARALGLHPLAPLLAAEAAVGWVLWGAVLAGWLRRPAERPLLVLLWLNLLALFAVWGARLAAGTLPR